MSLWIWITLVCFVVMLALHIVMFRLKWETREKWIRILKKIWKWIWIFLLICLILLIIDVIYGKIQYSKIPEVDESIFQRSEHQTPLPDDEDALIQLKQYENKWNTSELWHDLDAMYRLIYSNGGIYYKNVKIWWRHNQDECIVVYSWDVASCGTWVWNKDTLTRFLDSNFINFERNWKLKNDEEITIREYLDENEEEIKSDLQELDKILSMDYYLPNDKVLQLLPQYLQWYARGSMVLLIYYTYKWDWDMVDFIIKMNYKSVDIMNHLWCLVSTLISAVLQDVVDNTVNSVMQLFPEDLRLNLAKFYEENMRNREDLIHEMAKWEYVLYNEVKHEEIDDILSWFPLYSEKDTKRIMLYAYKLLYNQEIDEFNKIDENIFRKLRYSVYNVGWALEAVNLIPRIQSYNLRVDSNWFHKQALIENLKSGEYDVWYNEKQWNDNPDYYETYRLPTDEELNE